MDNRPDPEDIIARLSREIADLKEKLAKAEEDLMASEIAHQAALESKETVRWGDHRMLDFYPHQPSLRSVSPDLD